MDDHAISQVAKKLLDDNRVTIWHMGLFQAICSLMLAQSNLNCIQTSRRKLMELSKIKSIATYHKYMKQLVQLGYIRYEPSYHPGIGTRIFIQTLAS